MSAFIFNEVRPSLIVNAAAYTAVDKAETDPNLAEAVNATAPGIIGELAAMQSAGVIHYSTDYVFSGEQNRPYREGDATGPAGVYGQTKLRGEQALLAATSNAIILRTAWVYGSRGNNFLCTMQRLFKEQDELSVVDDQIGSPTWCKVIAEATAKILVQINMEPSQIGEVGGIYHLTNAGQTSWYGFARSILEASGLECALHPIPTSEYPTPAKRPAWSVLDNSKLKEAFGIILPDWKISLHHCISQQRELI